MTDAPLIEARNVMRTYGIRRGLLAKPAVLKAVDGVSFTLSPGKTLAVAGESGSGKSTLARLVTLIEPLSGGKLNIDGAEVNKNIDRQTQRRLRRTVQIIFQDPYGSLNPRKRVGAMLEEPLTINTDMPRTERTEAARDMIARVGLRPEHYGRYPHMFSGGQRQRIAIARALMLHPRVVVADEPVSALDVSVQAQVLNLLMELQEEFNLSYLFISHDLAVVRHIADDVMVMYLGRAVEHGPNKALFERPAHPYTRALLASTPTVDPSKRAERITLSGELPSPIDPPTGCAFHTRCPYASEQCHEDRPELRPVDGRLVSCHHAEAIGGA